MAKLCPKGKAAAKRKFKVYPSAYANMYASKVCKGKVRASAKDGGFIARGCGKIMSGRSKKNKSILMGDLKKMGRSEMGRYWSAKKDGKYQPCGRKSASSSKRKYPKCVPLAKATRMSASQRRVLSDEKEQRVIQA